MIKYRSLIIGLVLVLAAGIILGPRLGLFGREEFKPTPDPISTLEVAKSRSEPVFLEFYAKW